MWIFKPRYSKASRISGCATAAIVAVALLQIGGGCAHSRVRRADSAREAGDLAEADRLLERSTGRGLSRTRERASENLEKVRAERLALVRRLHEAALAVESRREVPVAEALAWYEAALALSRPEDESYEVIRSRTGELRDVQRRRVEAHTRALKDLRRMRRSCETEDLDAGLRSLIDLAWEANLDPPVELAWRFAEICFNDGRYDQSARLAERARRLEAYHHIPSPSSASLLKMALSLHRTGVRGSLVAALSEPEPATEDSFASEEVSVASARPAQQPRPQPRPVQRTPRRRPPNNRPVQAPSASGQSETPVEEPIAFDAIDLEPEPEPEPPPPTAEARDALSRARRLHSEGKVHAALMALDRSILHLADHPERGLLARQREEWEPEREALVGGYLTRAETALAAQRPTEAAEFYEKILEIEPAHSVSRDRLRRIEHLRSLR